MSRLVIARSTAAALSCRHDPVRVMPLASRATQTVPLHVLIFTKIYQVLTTRADYAQNRRIRFCSSTRD